MRRAFSRRRALAAWCSTSTEDRASHTFGKSYRDIVRAVHGDLADPPDVVAFPPTEADVIAVLDWCGTEGLAAIPYGGGSSVVGGVECAVGDAFAGAVSIDLGALDQVVDIDATSRAARIQAGALGPVLEEQLRPHGYTLRHFPQSFELSTLGGWLATRSGGHYASVYTHIDDLVESMRVVTPTGISESRRLPGSGAGPSPDRLFLGSEGSLGIITEAWMRVQDRPRWRASAGVTFERYADGVEATRAVAQSALFPTNCRLLDGTEAAISAGASGHGALLVLGFESADHPVAAWIERAVELCRDHGGEVPAGVRLTDSHDEGSGAAGRGDDAVGSWRSTFLRAPYQRNGLVRCGVIAETFETACTWDAFPALHASVTTTVEDALGQDLRRRLGDVPVHPRLPRRPGAVLQRDGPGTDRLRAGDVGRDQGRRVGRAHRPTAARSPTTTPSGAITTRGTASSDPTCSAGRSSRRSESSTRPGSSTPA